MLFWVALYIPITFMFVRILLIGAGILKSPVFRSSEKYGDNEDMYQILPQFLFWSGLMFSATGTGISQSGVNFPFVMEVFGTVLIVASWVSWHVPMIGLKLVRLPAWYFDLQENTGRYERRRLAYMWLRLPPRLKAVYSSNQRAFRAWADAIILSTVF